MEYYYYSMFTDLILKIFPAPTNNVTIIQPISYTNVEGQKNTARKTIRKFLANKV